MDFEHLLNVQDLVGVYSMNRKKKNWVYILND